MSATEHPSRPEVSGGTAVYALLGRPVAHSRSPSLHNAWFARHGLDAVYVCLEVPASVTAVGAVLRCLAGANVTVPLKAQAADAVDALTPLARASGAVNTVWREGGRLWGDNTDAEGFVRGLHAAFGPIRPERIAILGAGGAARAVAAGLAAHGAAEVWFLNRSEDRAEDAARRLASHCPATAFRAGPLAVPDVDLVVNATSGGARAAVEALPLPDSDLLWVDLNYWMTDPPHLAALAARGNRVLDGHPMLWHQAALAFERFTGITPDR